MATSTPVFIPPEAIEINGRILDSGYNSGKKINRKYMKLLSSKEIASVKLFEVEISEDELDVYERCMRYIYDNVTADEIEEILGAKADELLGICDSATRLLEQYTDLRSNTEQ